MHATHRSGRQRARLRASPGRLVRLRDGRAVVVRSAKTRRRRSVQQFVRELSPLARRRRFFGALSELSPAQLDRLTGAQNPRDLSLVALSADAGEPRIVAMAQYATDDPGAAEFAVVVADAWQRQGLGARLLELLLGRAAEAGVQVMSGHVLAENGPMLTLARDLASPRRRTAIPTSCSWKGRCRHRGARGGSRSNFAGWSRRARLRPR